MSTTRDHQRKRWDEEKRWRKWSEVIRGSRSVRHRLVFFCGFAVVQRTDGCHQESQPIREKTVVTWSKASMQNNLKKHSKWHNLSPVRNFTHWTFRRARLWKRSSLRYEPVRRQQRSTWCAGDEGPADLNLWHPTGSLHPEIQPVPPESHVQLEIWVKASCGAAGAQK